MRPACLPDLAVTPRPAPYLHSLTCRIIPRFPSPRIPLCIFGLHHQYGVLVPRLPPCVHPRDRQMRACLTLALSPALLSIQSLNNLIPKNVFLPQTRLSGCSSQSGVQLAGAVRRRGALSPSAHAAVVSREAGKRVI